MILFILLFTLIIIAVSECIRTEIIESSQSLWLVITNLYLRIFKMNKSKKKLNK